MSLITKLEWDTNFFGYKVGSCYLSNGEGLDFKLFSLQSKSYKLVYINSEVELNIDRIKLADKKVVLSIPIKKEEREIENDVLVYNYDQQSYQQLQSLAYASGVYSRYKIDKNFVNNEFRNLYTKWLDNSLIDTDYPKVFVVSNGKRLLGFISYDLTSKSLARIGLIAVSNEARGLGIATDLIKHVINQCLKYEIEDLEVVTQFANIPAMALYQKLGFDIKKINYIHHYWNYDTI